MDSNDPPARPLTTRSRRPWRAALAVAAFALVAVGGILGGLSGAVAASAALATPIPVVDEAPSPTPASRPASHAALAVARRAKAAPTEADAALAGNPLPGTATRTVVAAPRGPTPPRGPPALAP